MSIKKDELNKFTQDIAWEQGELEQAQSVLRVLHQEPQAMNRAEPPPGYEDHLLKALRSRLNTESVEDSIQTNKQQTKSFIQTWIESALEGLRRPVAAWTLVGGFATVAFLSTVLILQEQRHSGAQFAATDLLSSLVQRAESQDVERWLASVGGDDSVYGYGESALAKVSDSQMKRALDQVGSEFHQSL